MLQFGNQLTNYDTVVGAVPDCADMQCHAVPTCCVMLQVGNELTKYGTVEDVMIFEVTTAGYAPNACDFCLCLKLSSVLGVLCRAVPTCCVMLQVGNELTKYGTVEDVMIFEVTTAGYAPEEAVRSCYTAWLLKLASGRIAHHCLYTRRHVMAGASRVNVHMNVCAHLRMHSSTSQATCGLSLCVWGRCP
jgi:hypothetical protein